MGLFGKLCWSAPQNWVDSTCLALTEEEKETSSMPTYPFGL